MNKFIILDRDGVINVEKDYLYKIEDFVYETGVIESLKILQEKGYKFVIITNQAGIAKGYYTEEDYKKLEKYIINDLLKKGIKIEKIYYCPHHIEGIKGYNFECECRKPNLGNFLRAIKENDINVNESYMIGDRVTDLIPAKKLGIKTVLVETGYGKKNVKLLLENELDDTLIVKNMLEFVNKI